MATVKVVDKKPANVKTVAWGGITWTDITQPAQESMKFLMERFNFHPMDLDDALSNRQLSKIEEYPDYMFIVFHFQSYEKSTRISTRKQWSAFIGDNYLVTMHPAELKAIDEVFRECELSEEACREHLSQGSGYLLYQVLDRLLDAYFPVLDKITSLLEGIEDSVFSERVEAAQELSILRRDIITQRQVMFPTRTLLTELEKKLKRFTKIDLTIYYSDLMDHMNKICDTLNEHTEVIEVFKDADYLLSSYHANRGIRALTVMLAVLLPLIVVFGLFEMHSLFNDGIVKGGDAVFFILLALVIVIDGATLYFLRRRHLI